MAQSEISKKITKAVKAVDKLVADLQKLAEALKELKGDDGKD